jgi:hypothetical protein
MLCSVKSGVVVYVKHLPRMRSFYAAAFRMQVVKEAGDYCVLESEALR